MEEKAQLNALSSLESELGESWKIEKESFECPSFSRNDRGSDAPDFDFEVDELGLG